MNTNHLSRGDCRRQVRAIATPLLRLGLAAVVTAAFATGTAFAQNVTKDKVSSYPATMLGNGSWSDDALGHTGKAGDYAYDTTRTGGPAQVDNAAFLAAVNAAAAGDELSVALWVKKYDIAASSGFWFTSPTQGRAFQAHTPWSDDSIYFDTGGCCDGTTQRINASITTFPDYATTGDDTWWTTKWHSLVFTKKADVKQIWIDGELFLEGSSTGTIGTDITTVFIGSETATTSWMHSLIDNFAIFGKQLSQANAKALFTGTAPPRCPPVWA